MRARALLVTLAAGCGSHARSDLQVMSYTPQGAIDRAEAVEIRFDRPAIAEDRVGKPASPDSVTIAPALAWQGFWQDRQTLVIEPTGELAPSTRYEVTLGGDLGTRTAQFTFHFVHRPLAVDGIDGADADMLPPDGALPLSFNQPVRARDAAAHCTLQGEQGAIALAATADTTAAQLSLKPVAALVAGKTYTLHCAGLTGAGGNVALDKYDLAIRARPELAVVKLEPTGNDVAVDDATITATFTTPVTLDAARKALVASPAIPGLDQGSLSADGTEYRVTANLEVATDYRISIKKLDDRFGQHLTAPAETRFHTGDAKPRISMERGIFALEASANGYPVWTRNIGSFEVECGAVPKDRAVQVLTTDMNYDPWGGNDDDKPIDWKALHVRPKTATQRTSSRNRWLLHELDLGATCGPAPGARGIYLAEVRSDEVAPDPDRGWLAPRRNRVLANVTDLGVVIEAGTASGLVWVTSIATGEPVAGAAVTVFTPQGKQVFAGTTNADGIVTIPGSAVLKQQPAKGTQDPEEAEDWDYYRAQRLIATVEKAGDLAIVDGNWANGIQSWNFGVSEDRSGGQTRLRAFIQSDRGLYRPGETVHFKGLAREIATGRAPALPSAKKASIEVTDSRGQVVVTRDAKLSPFGGFSLDLELSAEAALGDYYVAATIGGQTFREKFSVEDFRPAAFELAAKPVKANPRPGERLAFDLSASYLFGAPVADAKVEWGVRKRKHVVRFAGFDDYTFSADPSDTWWWAPRDDDYGELVADGVGQTSARGHLAIGARDAAKTFAGPIDYILSAAVTDATDQTVTKSVVVTAHRTQFYLGMHANEMVQAVGMPFGVNLVAIAPDGTRVATKAHLSFVRTERSCDWQVVGARSYQHCDSTERTMLERDVDIAAGGSHTERIYPTEPGDYVVRAEAKDAAGITVAAASEIWVIGKGEAFWSGDEGDRMTVVASKPSYQVGDVARLVPQANLVKPTALVTIERDGVIDARVMRLDSASQGIELPIVDAWAPNVYASVAMVSGRHGDGDKNRPLFKMGLVELKVSSAHKELAVTVTLDRDHVRPGEPVTGTIHVAQDGKPVKAEVSLSAADEGVLQLISYETPNPMKTFYASYGLGVDAGTNWNRIARLADPESGDPDQGADRRSAGNGQRVRSKFVASAYWAPALVTDDAGDIHFTFTAPDNLTAYRLMAIAADAADHFGAGEQRLTVDKPLMAQPVLPRFLRSGDQATVGVEIFNHTAAAGVAVVTASANGASLDGHAQQVRVPANGSARVRFAAKASENAAATFTFAVTLGDEKDAVQVTIPIDRPRLFESRTVAEQTLGAGESWDGTVEVGPGVLASESTLAITIDRSGVSELAPSLHALVEYPYGCLEQTLSKLIPLVAAKDLARTLDDPALRGTRMEQFIRAGVAKVIRHQQGDGLFSLWPQSQTYPHLAAYALWGLTVAQQAGVEVPKDVFDRGIAALETFANSAGNLQPGGDGATLAMAAYVMALRGKPDVALDSRLFAIRAGLPRWGQAFLLRALVRAKASSDDVATLEKELVAGVTVTNGRALVRDGRDDMYMTSDVRATAMTLAALLEVDPRSPLIDPLAAGLKAERAPTGAWGTTQENLWSLVALAQYARRSAASGTTTATVTVDGKQVFRKQLGASEVATIHAPLGRKVHVSVDRGAHVSVRATDVRTDPGIAESHGFAIRRTYSATRVKAGDLVTVTLELDAAAAQRWVAVVDPLPAGLEIVNPNLDKNAASTRAEIWDAQELRDDRAQWFVDRLTAGHHTLTYQARATIAGTFTAMPSTIEAMYSPEVRGRSGSDVLTIER